MNNFNLKFSDKTRISHKIKRINPHHNWMLLLKIVFVAILILIGISLYLLFEIKNDQIFKVKDVPVNQHSVLDENSLEKVNKIFSERQANRELIKANDLLYIDPSN